jgi:iron complex outermembrane receptor protein
MLIHLRLNMNCAIQPQAIKNYGVLFLLFFYTYAYSQRADTIPASTLSGIEVSAYGQVRKLKDVPAAVGFVGRQTMERFSPASVVQAVNTVPGVRMEERSPGSYRINIRGSSLRSPFGVRNVKVYFNDIPYTDPGGQTYLNNLGYYNYGSIEILKGPGSSMYGAGTGGVLLIESLDRNEGAGVMAEYTTGSFGLHNAFASVTTGDAEHRSKFGYQHQQSEGYRRHASLRRDIISWSGNYRLSQKQALKTTFLYSHLSYKTPGALTLAEFRQNSKAARPAGGGFPGAVQSRASVTQKAFLAGASLTQQFSEIFSNVSTSYASFTELRNPAIRNYGKVLEPHVGGRTVFSAKKQWRASVLLVSFGGELQQNFSNSAVFRNAGGAADSLQTEDDIRIRQAFIFLQANLSIQNWEFTAGASLNDSKLTFRRLFPRPLPMQAKNLNDQLTPRLAIARKLGVMTVYSNVSKGFSPPTAAELLPTGSSVNLELQAEEGTNYDFGIRGNLTANLTVDFNAFYFRLKNTIVQRRDAGGGDFFTNAGRTSQKGLETGMHYTFWQNTSSLSQASLLLNHTYHHFRYKEFKQLAADFSGKALPGIAPHTLFSAFEVVTKNGLSANLTYYFNSKIPLNDANTAYADAFHVVGTKIGYEKIIGGKRRVRVVAGADNLLDQHYSLGNDINAFGGRYYNAASGRNYYVSFLLHLFSNP